MLIVETVAVSTMVCNDLVMPTLLRLGRFGARAGGDLTRLLLNIRRAAIVAVLMLGYLYFRVAGEAYALVSIGLISFAAVAQFAPALLGGIYWRGGTGAGALGGLARRLRRLGLHADAALGRQVRLDRRRTSSTTARFGIALLAPERLFGLAGLDNLTHSLFWSLSINLALYVGLSLARSPSAREASQALLFVDVFRRGGAEPVFWRGRARLDDLRTLAGRFLGPARASALFDEHAREIGVPVPDLVADARLVDRVERQVAGAVGTASARVMVESVAQEEPLSVDDVLEILDEASQLRGYARALEEKSRSLEQATGELRAANEQLQSLDHLKDDFMSSVTHELRTPLTSIRALSELMLDSPDMEPEQRAEFLGIIVSESERLSRLVNQVLDLAKIEAGAAEWHSTDVDLRALVQDAVRASSELFRERGAAVTLDLPDAVPALRADPDRLTQVMLNLLSNAAKFVPRDGGRVEVALRRDGDGLVVSVRDNGPGVPAAEQATVFEKFRQGGDALTRPPGTGLGLPISRQIVDHLGGNHVAGIGTGPGRVLRLPPAAPAGGKRHMGTKVLIADDEPNIVVSLELHDEARGLRRARRPRRHAGAGDDPRREAAPGAARRDDAGDDRLRRLRGGARRRERPRDPHPDAHREGARERRRARARRRRRRLRDQALLHPGPGGEGPGNAGVKLDRRLRAGRAGAGRGAGGLAGARRASSSARRSLPSSARRLAPLVASHGALVFGWWLAAAALGAWVVGRLYESHVAAPARLADATRLLVGDPAAPGARPRRQRPQRAAWPRRSTGSPTSGGRSAPTWRGWSRRPAARWRSSATSSAR